MAEQLVPERIEFEPLFTILCDEPDCKFDIPHPLPAGAAMQVLRGHVIITGHTPYMEPVDMQRLIDESG